MAFDPCVHLMKMLTIRAGQEIRKAKGLPEELNITKIYDEACIILGIPNVKTTTASASKLPAPHEMKKEDGTPVIPKSDCKQCGGIGTSSLHGLCTSCEDSEGGIYKTMWLCEKCGNKDKSKKFMVQWLNELGIDYKNALKKNQGITTMTDQGLK